MVERDPVEIGDLVFAKIKGYSPWPARVMDKSQVAGKFSVFFFGTYQTANIKQCDIYQYNDENKAKWGTGKKNKNLERALKEIEENPIDISEQGLSETPAATVKPKKPVRPVANVRSQHRKLYVQVKGTEDIIEIDVDKNRPKTFASNSEAEEWENKTLREILKYRKLIEEGKYVPEEVVNRLQGKINKTDEELEIIEKWKHVQLDRKEKIEWLKTEALLAQSDLDIRKCLSLEQPQLDQCLEILKEMNALQITPLMLKKQPQVVKSIQKISSYVGVSDSAENKQKALKIRERANAILAKIESCFNVPENQSFYSFFSEEMKQFEEKVRNWPSDKITYMTSE